MRSKTCAVQNQGITLSQDYLFLRYFFAKCSNENITFQFQDTKDVLADISKDDARSMQEKMLKQNVEGHVSKL